MNFTTGKWMKKGYRSRSQTDKIWYSFLSLISNDNEEYFIIIDIEQEKIITEGSKHLIDT